MEKIIINGGRKLVGEVEISGAKNAVVAIIPVVLAIRGIARDEALVRSLDRIR